MFWGGIELPELPDEKVESVETDVLIAQLFNSVTSIVPAIASPILMEEITLYFNPEYPSDSMESDEFTVSIIPRDPDLTRPNGEAARPLNVIRYDDTVGQSSITVKYGGAYSGIYDLEVSSFENGFLVTSDVQFEAKIAVTGFYPT